MRIAMINQTYYPMISGVSIVMQRLAEGMVARGNSVLVVAASENGPAYRVEEGNLRQVRIASWRNPLRVGQRFVPNPKNAVLVALEEFSPQLVHLHEPLQMGAAGVTYCRQAGIPSLLTIHAMPISVASYAPDLPGLRWGIEEVLWFFSRRKAGQFSCVVTPTQTVADLVSRKLRLTPRVISNGVDLGNFHPGPLEPAEEAHWRSSLGIPPGAPVILHVGRLDADKQVDILIRAAALVMKDTPAHLLVVGDGSKKDDLIGLCRELGIWERSHFSGYITVEAGLPAVYRLGALFVTASQIETQGLVLLEAAASGLPIVAIRATCLHEIVQHGETGFLVLKAEPRDLAISMLQLIQHPDRSNQMGRAGKELARRHSLEHSFDAYEDLYRSLTSERR